MIIRKIWFLEDKQKIFGFYSFRPVDKWRKCPSIKKIIKKLKIKKKKVTIICDYVLCPHAARKRNNKLIIWQRNERVTKKKKKGLKWVMFERDVPLLYRWLYIYIYIYTHKCNVLKPSHALWIPQMKPHCTRAALCGFSTCAWFDMIYKTRANYKVWFLGAIWTNFLKF